MHTVPRLALLAGSSRIGGNGAGLSVWLSQLLDRRFNQSVKTVEIVTIDPNKPPHPLGPIVDGSTLPAQIPDSTQYSAPTIQNWSKFVYSCSGFVIISPEYNGGYPGELKNCLDHLYTEWRDKPAMLVTYGGGGGLSCSDMLQTVLKRLKMQVVESPVGIKLPGSFAGGSERVVPGGTYPEFLTAYEGVVNSAADKLKASLFKKTAG